jgi:hypothetical protein
MRIAWVDELEVVGPATPPSARHLMNASRDFVVSSSLYILILSAGLFSPSSILFISIHISTQIRLNHALRECVRVRFRWV